MGGGRWYGVANSTNSLWVSGYYLAADEDLLAPLANTRFFFGQIGQFRVCQEPLWARFEAKHAKLANTRLPMPQSINYGHQGSVMLH